MGEGVVRYMRSMRFGLTNVGLLCIFFSVSPLFFFSFDHWDGVIYHYALLQDDFAGVHRMHQEVGAFILSYVYYVFDLIGQPFGTVAFTAFPMVALTVFSLGVLSVIRLFTGVDRLGWTAVLIAVSSPVAALASSSMLSPLFLIVGIGLFGVVLVSDNRFGVRIVGWLLVLIGLSSLHSALAMVGLAILGRLTRLISFGGRAASHPANFAEPFIFGAIAVAIMAGLITLHPPHGMYEGYSALSLGPHSLVLLAKNAVKIFAPSLPAFLLLLWLFRRPAWGDSYFPENWNRIKNLLFISIPLLSLLNAIPFALTARNVPNPTNLLSVGSGAEDYRYLIFAFALAQIFFVVVLEKIRPKRSSFLMRSVFIALMLVFPLTSARVWLSYLNLDMHKQEVVVRWRGADWTDALVCSVNAADIRAEAEPVYGYTWRFYDLNYLAFHARGKSDRFLCNGECSVYVQLDLVQKLCAGDGVGAITYIFDGLSCNEAIGYLQTELEKAELLKSCFLQH